MALHLSDEWFPLLDISLIEELLTDMLQLVHGTVKKLMPIDNIEEEAIELEESPRTSTQQYESLNGCHGSNAPESEVVVATAVIDHASTKKEEEPLLEVQLPEHATEGKPPTHATFYDEMICLLQEKLEDPENYATVVDDQDLTNNATFYMDPLSMKKPSS